MMKLTLLFGVTFNYISKMLLDFILECFETLKTNVLKKHKSRKIKV